MPSSIKPATPTNPIDAVPATPTPAAAPATDPGKPAVIASRRCCEADGVGLSHYILMDRKAGQ